MHAVYTHTTSHTQTKHWTSLSVICMLLQFVWLVLATGFILLLLSNNFSPLSTPPHTPNPYMHTYAHTNTHTSLHPKTVCKIKSQWNMPCMIRRAAMQKCVQESSKNKALCFFWGGCDVWAGCVCVCVCLCLCLCVGMGRAAWVQTGYCSTRGHRFFLRQFCSVGSGQTRRQAGSTPYVVSLSLSCAHTHAHTHTHTHTNRIS